MLKYFLVKHHDVNNLHSNASIMTQKMERETETGSKYKANLAKY